MHEGRASLTTAHHQQLRVRGADVLGVPADGVVRRAAGADDGGGVPGRGLHPAGDDQAAARRSSRPSACAASRSPRMRRRPRRAALSWRACWRWSRCAPARRRARSAARSTGTSSIGVDHLPNVEDTTELRARALRRAQPGRSGRGGFAAPCWPRGCRRSRSGAARRPPPGPRGDAWLVRRRLRRPGRHRHNRLGTPRRGAADRRRSTRSMRRSTCSRGGPTRACRWRTPACAGSPASARPSKACGCRSSRAAATTCSTRPARRSTSSPTRGGARRRRPARRWRSSSGTSRSGRSRRRRAAPASARPAAASTGRWRSTAAFRASAASRPGQSACRPARRRTSSRPSSSSRTIRGSR